MNHESEDRLMAAARALRETPAHPDVVARGERAVLAKIGWHRGSNRPVLLWAAGFTAATAVVGLFALAPTRASAAEILRIAQNADRGLRHIRYYTVQGDGLLKLGMETYAQAGRRRSIDEFGNQMVYDGDSLTRMYPDGKVTLERQGAGTPPADELSARALLAQNTTGQNVRIVVARGSTLDRYTIDRDVIDARGESLHNHYIVDVDPQTERPLKMCSRLDGVPDHVATWDYPAPDPTIFHLPIGPNTPVYDLDVQRASVLATLARTGTTAMVAGVKVELAQAWVDEFGNASAIVHADYDFPYVIGTRFNEPEPGPSVLERRWTREAIQRPSPYGGRAVQIIKRNEPEDRGPRYYPDRVTVRVPVFRDLRLLGYATFKDVPVHRTQSVSTLL